MKQKDCITGLYYRLSKDDEKAGESLSIENQRILLRKYAEEHGLQIYDEYIDDGVSGTTFDRPQVQRLLNDAKSGAINTILVKDLSRFGRNYIEVGQYVDYVFPSFGIRFIAIQDNIDTENRDSGAMEMMPIMNVFNEWHAANTSKKIRAVIKAKANEGIFRARKAPYGYLKGTDAKKTLVIDEDTAPIVVRIFEMYASGISLRKITETLNAENIPSPGRYAFEKFGIRVKSEKYTLWEYTTLHMMLNNMTYLGHLMQLRSTSVSYKNHKRYNKDQSEWAIVYNAHPPIISQELWDKAKEHQKSVAHGRKTKIGDTPLLSGFVFCADCGAKMKMCGNWNKDRTKYNFSFNCGDHQRYGKAVCFSHHITEKLLVRIILDDIREMAQRVTIDEDAIRKEYIRQNAEITEKAIKADKKELFLKRKRLEDSSRMIQVTYEDRVTGKMPEEICFGLIEKYSNEQKTLSAEIAALESKINEAATEKLNVDGFIKSIKKYLNAPTLTREMCYELIDRIVVGGVPRITGKERTIDIVYKIDISSALRHKFPH